MYFISSKINYNETSLTQEKIFCLIVTVDVTVNCINKHPFI